ncbi:hypothetical protein UA45_17295, partial [Morganella morganii]
PPAAVPGCSMPRPHLAAYATVFEELNALAHFEAFCSLNGPAFYGLPVNDGFIELTRQEVITPETINGAEDILVPFLAGTDAAGILKSVVKQNKLVIST